MNQEWIELDLFHHALAQFSVGEFEAAGLNAADRFLIEFMADQEVGHATMLTNILGRERLRHFHPEPYLMPPFFSATAAKPCNYTYPFTTVREFVDFCQKVGTEAYFDKLAHS